MADNMMPMPPGAQGPPPGGQMQILLPPPLQEVMQQFPDVVKRLGALEAKPAAVSPPPTKLVAAFAYLAGFGTMSLFVFLWNYASVIFRL